MICQLLVRIELPPHDHLNEERKDKESKNFHHIAISKERTGGTIMKSEGKPWLEIHYTFSCIFPVYSYMVGVVTTLIF